MKMKCGRSYGEAPLMVN